MMAILSISARLRRDTPADAGLGSTRTAPRTGIISRRSTAVAALDEGVLPSPIASRIEAALFEPKVGCCRANAVKVRIPPTLHGGQGSLAVPWGCTLTVQAVIAQRGRPARSARTTARLRLTHGIVVSRAPAGWEDSCRGAGSHETDVPCSPEDLSTRHAPSCCRRGQDEKCIGSHETPSEHTRINGHPTIGRSVNPGANVNRPGFLGGSDL